MNALETRCPHFLAYLQDSEVWYFCPSCGGEGPEFAPKKRIAARDREWIQVGNVRNNPIKFYPLAPKEEDIHVVDIAHALSNLCRYTGHVRRFYSVAEHCVRVSWRAEELIGRPRGFSEEARIVAFQGLLHDASEAYLGDVSTPLKRQPEFEAYREVEKRLQRMIFRHFYLPEGQHPLVKQADKDLLWTEVRDLMQPTHPDWIEWRDDVHYGGQELANQKIGGWTPDQAYRIFVRRFETLCS